MLPFIIFHFDEKWFYEEYIKQYTSIEPSYDEFLSFLDNIVKKSKKDVVITTGQNINFFHKKLIKNFSKINNFQYYKQIHNYRIHLAINLNFFDLEYLVSKSSLFIGCHGAAIHLSSSLNIKILDIFEKKRENFYNIWIKHLRNYNFIYRNKYTKLSAAIVKFL